MIRKMYDSDPQSQEGGGQQSIASLMAQQGRMTENNKVIIPNVSGKSEAKTEEPKSVEPTNETQPNQQSQVPETKSNNKEPLKWQEVLKNQQPDEVLKELGYNNESVRFLNQIKDADPKVLH